MRAFNDSEKAMLKLITAINRGSMTTCDRFLQDNFFTKQFGRAMIVDHTQKLVRYYIDASSFGNITKVREANHDLFEVLNLLAYLKERRYVTIVTASNPISNAQGMYSDFDINSYIKQNRTILSNSGIYIKHSNTDEIYDSNNKLILKGGLLNEYYDFIRENVFGLIFPSEELIQFVKKEFKTAEDIKHEENISIANDSLSEARNSVVISKTSVSRATVAIWVSVLLALISISSAFYIFNLQAKNETKLNSNQYYELTDKLEMVSKSIEKVKQEINIIRVPDTIKTVIVEPVELKSKKK